MKGMYDEVYCGSNSTVLQYRELIKKQASTQGVGDTFSQKLQGVPEAFKVLERVRSEKEIRKAWQRKRSLLRQRHQRPFQRRKGMQLFTLLPVKTFYKVKYID
jgi:hypothetical protein